jgi:uncharacterized protein (TIGR03435 family)
LVAANAHAAQTAPARPTFDAFEVATIKPSAPDSTGRFIRMQSAHQFIARNCALKTLIAAAYNVSPKAISGGPSWIESERFDILAEAPGEVRPNLDEQMAMLRKLLVERFKLTFHREQREMPVYAITVAKGGAKLKDSAPDASPEGPPPLIFVIFSQYVQLPAKNATMGELASVMQRAALDRPVIDQTGIAGRYDFDLQWTPDDSQFGGGLRTTADENSKPDLLAAMQQQLGLRLVAINWLVDTLVIDQAMHPSAN